MTKVFIKNETKHKFIYKSLYTKIAKESMKLLKIKGKTEVNIVICNNDYIKKVSLAYKKGEKATDVLSFPADWKNLSPLIGYNMLGDIIISYEKVISQAKEFNHSVKREWCYLFAHGLLHLCGYDHVIESEEIKMNLLAKKIMERVKVSRYD